MGGESYKDPADIGKYGGVVYLGYCPPPGTVG